MSKNFNGGNSNIIGILIIIFLFFVILLAPPNEKRNQSSWNNIYNNNSTNTSNENSEIENKKNSDFKNIIIGSGNANIAYQSFDEYITIQNQENKPVDITGWKIKNGKSNRAYNYGGGVLKFSSDSILIPQGSVILPPRGDGNQQNIILNTGDRAIITTGSIGVQTPYKISSFKENKCTGYIEAHEDYSFNPPLSQNCPRPADEPGLRNLESSCRKFIERLPSCQIPKITQKDFYGEPCDTCVNGERLSSMCVNFIKERFNYEGCIKNHSNDFNFQSENTWRIFLGRGWEMYASDYETIELYDKEDRLVNFINY